MSNLIDLNRKRELKKIFILRLILISLSWMIFGLLLMFVGLIFTYSLTKIELQRHTKLLNDLQNLINDIKIQTESESVASILSISNKILHKKKISFSDAARDIIMLLINSDIKIKRVSLLNSDENTNSALTIKVSALAHQKQDVINLVQTIKANKSFSEIDMQNLISSLQQDEKGGLHFNFSIKYQPYEE